MIKLSIIILSYNTKELTLRCIKSIINQYKKHLENGDFEIIIVDNASSDDTVESLKKETKESKNIFIIENNENLGFSKGNNLGAKKTRGEYILFLNSDTEVLDDGFLRMIKFLSENRQIGILGGKLKNFDGSIQKSAGKFYNLKNVFLMLIGLERFRLLRESLTRDKKVDWVSGGCMMTRTDLFKKIGGFDENFFMYLEDMEICFKAKLNGFLTYFYPSVSILHKELGSSNKSFAIINIYKGLLYFYKKYKPYWQYLILLFLLKAKAWCVIAIGKLLKNIYLTQTYEKAFKAI